MSLRGTAVLAAMTVAGTAAGAAAATLRLDEATTRLRMHEDRIEVQLVVQNATGVTLEGEGRLELVDPSDVVKARAEEHLTISPGLQPIVIDLRPGVSALGPTDRPQILHYRLRYRLEVESPPAETPRELAGVMAVSRLTPDVFELRLMHDGGSPFGRPLHVVVQAAHPVTARPVSGVAVEVRLVLDDERQTKVSATRTTDARGLAVFDLAVPTDVQHAFGADLSAVGRRAGLTAEVSSEVMLLRLAGILVSTDKPLYQPGQVLHLRALARSGESGPALADLPLRVQVLDEPGEVVFETSLQTSRFGLVSADWTIPEHARLGSYRVSVAADEKAGGYRGGGGAALKVSRYELPTFAVRTVPDQSYYLPGQKPRVEVRADYLFGKPVTRGHARVVLESSRSWNYRQQRYDVEERASQEAALSESGSFTASFALDGARDFPEADDWRPYRDIEGTAYVTDATTGRTEEGRFTLRTSRDPIHVYLIERYAEPCPENEDRVCWASFYVSASYADGTPASCEVTIARRRAPIDAARDGPWLPPEPLTSVRTSRFGLARLSDLKVDAGRPGDEGLDRTRLVLTARDAKGRTGRHEDDLRTGWSSSLRVDSGHAIHLPGQPVEVTVGSRSVRGAVVVDLVSASEVLASRLVQLRGSSASVVFPYDPRFKGALKVMATSLIGDDGEWSNETGSCGVLYPTQPALRLDVRSDRAEYRPGEEAQVHLALRRGDGRPATGVLGLVVLDKALEERAASERGLAQPAGFLAPLRDEDTLGGVSLRDLLALDPRQPVPADLDLVAEVALGQRWYGPRERHTSEAFERDTAAAFSPRFQRQLQRVSDVLRQRFDPESGGPTDLETVTRLLSENALAFASERDPWERPYRLGIDWRGGQVVVEVHSDGPDKRPHTGDDLLALSRSWSYFSPRGRLIDRAARQHYERTGEPIRNLERLQAELATLGADLDGWRDPWGHAFRFEFALVGPFALVTSKSPGPNGVFEPKGRSASDDVTLATARTEYFARDKRRIQQALDAGFTGSGTFPQTREEWEEVLARAGLASQSLVDPWGHPLLAVFRSESAYADRVTIRSYAELQGEQRKRTETVPVTRAVEVVALWSGGPDGSGSSADDFEMAAFRRTVAERESAVGVPSPGGPIVFGSGTGAIGGTVTDATGGVVPGARVAAKGEASTEEWAVTSDAKGEYLLKGLPPGFYLVTVKLTGFKSALITRVPVRSGDQTQLDVVLAVSAVAERLEVLAAAPLLHTTSASVGTVLQGAAQTDRGRPPMATPRVRRDFPETLYWQPALETDTLGAADVRLKLADTLTTWRLAVMASTVGGQVAMAERELVAFQPFFVENDPPPVLTAGDAIRLPALVRNYTGEALRVSIDAQADAGLRLAGAARHEVRVPGGDVATATFDLRAEAAARQAKVTLRALSSAASDAVEKSVAVHPDGAETELVNGLLVEREAALELVVPEDAIAGSIQAELRVAPHLASHVLASVEALMQRPYGCAEQTISSTYPSLLALRLMAEGRAHPSLQARARRYLDLGYQRLLGYQVASGGFAYFRNQEADLALTAYALRFLADARAFLDVDEQPLDRARSFLLSQQEPDGRWRARAWYRDTEDDPQSRALTALVARTLASLREPAAKTPSSPKEPSVVAALGRALSYLGAGSDPSDPYDLASLALAAQAAQATGEERRARERLRMLMRDEAGGGFWATEVNTPFYGWGRAGRIETTALAVKALAASGEAADHPFVEKGLLFLLRNRDRYGLWWSGQATVNVLEALVTLIGAPSAVPLNAASTDTLDVIVNGRPAGTVTLPTAADDIGPLTIDLTPYAAPGVNRIELRRPRDGGRVSAQAVATYYLPWSRAQLRSSDSLRFDVRFDKKEARTGAAIGVHVEAERVGFRGYGMLLAEIGLPPGVVVDRESLDRAVASSGYAFCLYEIQPDRVVAYLWPRAGGVAFDFLVRPRLGMTAQSAASRLYDYYNPEASVTVPPQGFVVRE